MKTVAAALAIHPFMLSKWRKDARDGRLHGRAAKAPPRGPAREIAQLQALERAHALLQEEHELLKKPFGSVPLEGRHVRLHRRATRAVQRSLPVPALRCDGGGLLRLGAPWREPACGAGPSVIARDRAALRAAPRALWQSADLSGLNYRRLGGEPASCRTPYAHGPAACESGARLPSESGRAPALRSPSESPLGDPRGRAESGVGR